MHHCLLCFSLRIQIKILIQLCFFLPPQLSLPMLLSTSVVDKVQALKKDATDRDDQMDRAVSLYIDPPSEEITLDEFELYALDRLQLLRGIESLRTRGFEGNDYDNKVKQLESKYMPLRANRCDFCQ